MPTLDNNGEQKIRCTIKRMYNGCPKENGWFGCFAHIRGEQTDVRLTGTTTVNLQAGMQLDAIIRPSKRYEGSFDITSFDVVTKTKTGLVSYLASLPGVSRDIAHNIVAVHGESTLDAIKDDPESVKKEFGLSDRQIKSLTNGINNSDTYNALRKFLPELSANMIKRVKELIPEPNKTITSNPYILKTVPGISFKTADTVALRLGIEPFSLYRLENGLIHLLETDATGNLYINLTNSWELDNLRTRLENLLSLRFHSINTFADKLKKINEQINSPIFIENYETQVHLYDRHLYESIISFKNHIDKMLHSDSSYDELCEKRKCKQSYMVHRYETENSILLTDEQKQAVNTALTNKVSIITGGPGRGKTSVIDCIASCWPGGILLLAPTGKAMHKLKTATRSRYTTMTIDKLIVSTTFQSEGKNGNKSKNNKKYSENSPNTLCIIDESSMIDIEKAANMFNILDECQICFVGDIDQLPPINPGHVLKDMLNSGVVPSTYLTKPLRNNGLILSNADKINQNDDMLTYDFKEMPFYPQEHDDDVALDAIIERYNIERTRCPDITQIALLCPVKKGVIGTINLNITIQNIMCPLVSDKQPTRDNRRNAEVYLTKGTEIYNTIYGSPDKYTKFRIGDIVMCTKNMNDAETHTYSDNDYWNGDADTNGVGIFNGDCGRIIAYYPSNPSHDYHDVIVVQFFDDRIAELDCVEGEFESFELGYALTVHKSQGCEYQTVIYISPNSLLNNIHTGFACKNLAYTAITRAKNKVVIMGSKESLSACIKNNIPKKNSNVEERLRNL